MNFVPSEKQLLAIHSTADQLLIVAPPGCGKTEVLAMRAANLIDRGNIRPHRKLLATTFTKRSRDKMALSIRQSLSYQSYQDHITVHNYHGLAGRVIRAHGATLGIPGDVVFPSKQWMSRTMKKFTRDWKEHSKAREVLREIKSRPLNDDEILAMVEQSGNSLAYLVESSRRKENRLDYDDLLRHCQRLLHVPRIANLYQNHFDAMVVDEFQDLSEQQLDIVSTICVSNNTYAGDPHQGIYSWAGARTDTVAARLGERSSEIIQLNVSFRSSPEVLRVVNAISSRLGAAPLTASNPGACRGSGLVANRVFDNDSEEAEEVVRLCQELVDQNPRDSIGVIARSGHRRKAIDHAMSSIAKFDVQFWDLPLDTPGMLASLKSLAIGISRYLPMSTQIELIKKRVLSDLESSDVETIAEALESLELLESRLAETDNVAEYLSRCREVDVTSVVPPGVHILNAHIGKGQQFDWVIAVGLEEGHVPDFRSTSETEIMEERRVLLVMLSRARRGIVVTRAKEVATQYGPRQRDQSRWWDEIVNACDGCSNNLKSQAVS